MNDQVCQNELSTSSQPCSYQLSRHFFYWSAVWQVYGIPLLFITLHHSQSSAALFTSVYFADDVCSLSIFSHFLPRDALPFILPSIISRSNTSFLSTCRNHLCFRCQIVFNKLLASFTFSRTGVLVTLSFQLIFSTETCLYIVLYCWQELIKLTYCTHLRYWDYFILQMACTSLVHTLSV